MGLGRARPSHVTLEDTTLTCNSGGHVLHMGLKRTRPSHGAREDSTFTWSSGGHDLHTELGRTRHSHGTWDLGGHGPSYETWEYRRRRPSHWEYRRRRARCSGTSEAAVVMFFRECRGMLCPVVEEKRCCARVQLGGQGRFQ